MINSHIVQSIAKRGRAVSGTVSSQSKRSQDDCDCKCLTIELHDGNVTGTTEAHVTQLQAAMDSLSLQGYAT